KHHVECYPMPNALNPCEDVMGYQWLRISVWIVVALAVVGNVAVLVVILSIRSESPSVPRFLMGHLAFADLCLGLYLLLIAAIDAHSMGAYFNYAYDWQYVNDKSKQHMFFIPLISTIKQKKRRVFKLEMGKVRDFYVTECVTSIYAWV
ncbi:lutropin-choriogonadotropic hormone receptor-like, partial [Rhagoletis pomonella]|uniref:lutropin-choriogonadotropic hormone receptor-like n=1 Tax=Rhagoletis pomonella TaxID=28610 RepID=UPI00177DC682